MAACTFDLGRGRFSSKLEIIQGYTVSPFLKGRRKKKELRIMKPHPSPSCTDRWLLWGAAELYSSNGPWLSLLSSISVLV